MHESAKTTVNSPYVFLFYKNMSPRDFGLENNDHKSVNITFEFYPDDSTGSGFVNWRNSRVERCGIRLLYARDLKKLGFLCEDDEEEDEESEIVEEDVESIVEEESYEIETVDSEDEDETEQHLGQNQSSSPHLEENKQLLEPNGSVPHLEEIRYKRNSILRKLQITYGFYKMFNLLKRSSGIVNPEASRLNVTSQPPAIRTLPLTSQSAAAQALAASVQTFPLTSQSVAVQTLPASGLDEVVTLLKELQDQNTKIWQRLSQLGITKSQLPGLHSGVPQANC